MVRRRWAAVVALVACLLLLQLVIPGLAGEGRAAVVAAVESDAAWSAGAEGAKGAKEAEEPCPCEEEPSRRQPAARTQRAAAVAAGVSPGVTGASVPVREGPGLRAVGTGPCPGAVGSALSAARLQTFRC